MDIEKIKVRGVTRGEIKGLKSEGIHFSKIAGLEEEKREDALDKLFEMACPEFDADQITPGQSLRLYERIVEATYMTGAKEKNSDSPQS